MNYTGESQSKPVKTPIADLFDFDNVDWYRQFMLRLRYNIDLKAYGNFAGIVANSLNQLQQFKMIPPPDEDFEQLNEWGRLMQTDGYADLGELMSKQQRDDVFAYLEDKKVRYFWDRALEPFSPDSPPPNVSVGGYDRKDIMAAPHLHMLANHPRVVGVAARLLGVMPSLMATSMWWSFPGRVEGEHAELFHIDRHCYRFCKLFIYLTDVDEDSGPHVYVRATGNYGANYAHAAKKAAGNEDLLKRYNAILGKQRKTDAEIEELFGAERVAVKTAPAGSAILGNTGSIHKGQHPKTNRRLLFSALYTMLPTIKDPVDRMPAPDLVNQVHSTYPGAYTDDQICYLNRLVSR
ncbi:hypothetical protein [uncultured Nisaea sp.]|uniref:hypothetical protein n=1 Tax=uncultured Nisaea sp. TaxID=538215 RepID=UPI0030ED7EEA|tara:strand:+ start:1206 stop:2255 length:1050 start_codon:yes stop_codon:yes gene_type:complete